MSRRSAAYRLTIQKDILQCLWAGLTIKQTAHWLCLKTDTTTRIVRRMMEARKVDSHVGLCRKALEEGLIQ